MNITMCVFQKNWQKWDKVSCMLRPADKQRVSTAAPGSVSKFQFVVFLHISIRALLFVGKWEWIKPCPWKYSSHLQLESVFSPFTNFAKLLHGARVHSDTQCYWLIHEHFTLITFILFWFFIFWIVYFSHVFFFFNFLPLKMFIALTLIFFFASIHKLYN